MELAITSTSMKLRDRAPVVFRGEDNWCFEQIRSIGYDGVELHIHDSSQLDRKQLKEELDQFGLSLTSLEQDLPMEKTGCFYPAKMRM